MAGVCEGECKGCRPGDEPLTLTRCHICGLPQLYEALEGPNLQFKGHKGENFIFSFSFLSFVSLSL